MTIHIPGFPGQTSTHIGHGLLAAGIVLGSVLASTNPLVWFLTATATVLGFALRERADLLAHDLKGYSRLRVMDEVGTTIIGDMYGDMLGPIMVWVCTVLAIMAVLVKG